MNDELHAARFVEESFEYHRVQSRQTAERRLARTQVLNELKGGRLIEPYCFQQPGKRRARFALEPPLDFLPQPGDRRRQFHGAARCLTEPERNRGRLAM